MQLHLFDLIWGMFHLEAWYHPHLDLTVKTILSNKCQSKNRHPSNSLPQDKASLSFNNVVTMMRTNVEKNASSKGHCTHARLHPPTAPGLGPDNIYDLMIQTRYEVRTKRRKFNVVFKRKTWRFWNGFQSLFPGGEAKVSSWPIVPFCWWNITSFFF